MDQTSCDTIVILSHYLYPYGSVVFLLFILNVIVSSELILYINRVHENMSLQKLMKSRKGKRKVCEGDGESG